MLLVWLRPGESSEIPSAHSDKSTYTLQKVLELHHCIVTWSCTCKMHATNHMKAAISAAAMGADYARAWDGQGVQRAIRRDRPRLPLRDLCPL